MITMKEKINMTLRIAGIDHEVKEVHDLARVDGATGHFDPILKEIRIDEDQHPQEKQRILLHEILEAVDREFYLKLDHNGQLSKLDAALFQIFKDNPQLLRLFLDEKNGND
jgi:hypothetical protein